MAGAPGPIGPPAATTAESSIPTAPRAMRQALISSSNVSRLTALTNGHPDAKPAIPTEPRAMRRALISASNIPRFAAPTNGRPAAKRARTPTAAPRYSFSASHRAKRAAPDSRDSEGPAVNPEPTTPTGPQRVANNLASRDRAGDLCDRFAQLSTVPSGTYERLTREDLEAISAIVREFSATKPEGSIIFICSLTYRPPGEQLDGPRTLIVFLPRPDSPRQELLTVIGGAHTSITNLFPPPSTDLSTESFELVGKKEGQRSSCGLAFLLETAWTGFHILPVQNAPDDLLVYSATFTYVRNEVDQAAAALTQLVVGRPPPVKRSSEFSIDVEVEYHGAARDHGSRFFTMYGLRLGDDREMLFKKLMEVDIRARLAVRFGIAQVAFWFEGRKIEAEEKVDFLWSDRGRRKLLQAVCYPKADAKDISSFAQKETQDKRRKIADQFTSQMTGYRAA